LYPYPIKEKMIMARKVEPTPILEGNDAKVFLLNLRNTLCHKLTPIQLKERERENQRMKRNYELMRSISNGQFY
jgi:hypothetical protein